MSNNTTTTYPSYFPRALDLIEGALKRYDLHTENWAYPTEYRFGIPHDKYYAEVWHNGMDWQSNYWLIETSHLSSPTCVPLIVFDNDDTSLDRFNYFGELVKACLHYRRDITWLKAQDQGHYGDAVWSFMWKCDPEVRGHKVMIKMGMSHASQRPVEFYLNESCAPLGLIRVGRPSSARDPVNYKKIVNEIIGRAELIPLLLNIDPELDGLIEKELRKPGPIIQS